MGPRRFEFLLRAAGDGAADFGGRRNSETCQAELCREKSRLQASRVGVEKLYTLGLWSFDSRT